jgi:sugar lactone lactonase YvrE
VEVVGDGFSRPAAVKFDSLGRLYLVDYLTGEVWQINTQTGKKASTHSIGTAFG